MAHLVSKLQFVAAVAGLIAASNGYAAETSVAAIKNPPAAAIGPWSADARNAVPIVTDNQRETNLQKTPSSITVLGIEEIKRRRKGTLR